jgi:hypothetical protein
LKILLHKLNFHINGFDSFLFIGRWKRILMLAICMGVARKEDLILVLFGSLERIDARQRTQIRAYFLDFRINIDIKLLNAFNELVECRFHLLFNGIHHWGELFADTKRQWWAIELIGNAD